MSPIVYMASMLSMIVIGHEVELWLEPGWRVIDHPALWARDLRYMALGVLTMWFWR